MSTGTKIEWTDATWNPVTGCDRVSRGCDHCYAETMAARFGRPFLGAVECHPDRLDMPLRWRKQRRVFVNSVSDLFHPDVPDAFIVDVYAVMAVADRSTFQVLTKRPQRMAALVGSAGFADDVWDAVSRRVDDRDGRMDANRRGTLRRRERAWLPLGEWPLPNVWLGVSVEDQRYADLRIPHLLATPAAVRFLSVEPILGPVTLADGLLGLAQKPGDIPRPHVDWVIVGGESGRPARPMHPDWARTIRDECVAAGVPFFFKQHGTWGEADPGRGAVWVCRDASTLPWDPIDGATSPYAVAMRPLGKGRTGRELDGRTWDEYPR